MATSSEFRAFPLRPEHIREALDVAERKFPHICTFAPDGTPRDELKIKTNIFHGTLAQLAVETVFLESGATHVEIYDRTRTDSFEIPDQWDIRATFKSKARETEVRRSYINANCDGKATIAEKLDCIASTLRLLSDYQTSYKPGENDKELFFQVYWPYRQPAAIKFYESCLNALPNDLGSCYVVGFATQKLLAQYGVLETLNQGAAKYRTIRIHQAFPCSKLREIP